MATLTLSTNDFLVLNGIDEQEIVVKKVTVKDFVKFIQLNSDKKYELINGVIIAMSNATPTHGQIISNCGGLFVPYLSNHPCVFYSDMQCKIDDENCPHPDLLVVCNKSVESRLLENPTVVGEVLSSNRKNDFDKLVRYQNCNSIQEILMIEQTHIEITVYRRNANAWSSTTYKSETDLILLDSINFSFSVSDVYNKVKIRR